MKTPTYKIPQGTELPRTIKYLNADELIGQVRSVFAKVKDIRAGNARIPLVDALMSAFAVFCLKDPSLLAFDQRRMDGDPNLKRVFGIEHVPCDTQLREILDAVSPDLLRPAFKKVFSLMQRAKKLEQMRFLGKYYLVSADGTEYFYSTKLGNDACLVKKPGGAKDPAYHAQFFGACIVHPDFREVIPLCPMPIVNQDGVTKNDSEQVGAKRLMRCFRQDHPHLPTVFVEDALHSNAPHIRDLQSHNLEFIIGAKESDHAYLYRKVFEEEQAGRSTDLTISDPDDPKKKHRLFFVNGVPLNKSNPDVIVNFLEYWEIHLDDDGEEIDEKEKHFGWVTSLEITEENVYEIMRAGRSRWKIENETFNTLKNQGYHLEHNFGLGQKYLSQVFMTMTMLAFLVDQAQQLCCGLFRAAWEKSKSKRALWEKVRAAFIWLEVDSMRGVFQAICEGRRQKRQRTGSG